MMEFIGFRAKGGEAAAEDDVSTNSGEMYSPVINSFTELTTELPFGLSYYCFRY